MMKKDIEINERIESYLKGTLSEEDMKRVRDRMKEDASFAKQVEAHRQLHDVITDSVYLGVRNELKNVHLNKMRTLRNIRRITGFGSAGLIVGLAVVFLVVRKPESGDIPQEDTLSPVKQQIIEQPATEEIPAGGDVPAGISSPEEVTGTQMAGEGMKEEGMTGREAATEGTDVKVGSEVRALQQQAARKAAAPAPSPESSKDAGEGPIERTGSIDVVTGRDAGGPDEEMPDAEQPDAATAGREQTDRLGEDDQAAGAENPVSDVSDCSNVNIEGSLIIEVSCNNEPTGSIQIDGQSLRGGSPPYSFSLSQKTYTDTPVFSSLYAGNYSVYARDAAGCIKLLQNAVVGSEDCTYEHVFAPMQGQVWTVPVRDNGNGTLIIYSKEGNVVYQVPVRGDEETLWQGETVSGQGLPMGLYPFEIRYDDGTRFIGTVTLVR